MRDRGTKPRERSTALSRRERQVVQLIRQGKKNSKIAQELGLTPDTVRIYVSRMFRKTGTTNRTELAIRCGGEF